MKQGREVDLRVIGIVSHGFYQQGRVAGDAISGQQSGGRAVVGFEIRIYLSRGQFGLLVRSLEPME